jgi:hypothetical protein
LDQLQSVLRTLPAVEAQIIVLRYGLRNGTPLTRAEAAANLDLSAAEVLRLEADAFRRMRHPSRSQVLVDYVDSDPVSLPDGVRARIMGQADAPAVGRCARHGYFELATGSTLCSVCPCPVTPARAAAPDLGRPRRHCSNACRQASYRQRYRVRKAD